MPPASDLDGGSNLDNPPATVPGDLRGGQVRAATADAGALLRESILQMEVGRGLRVRDLVDRTRSADLLDRALAAARPLGGPRWVDDQTCQVQITVPGSAVADAVAMMAKRYPGGRPPVRVDALASRLAAWRSTAFSATGSSAAGGVAVQGACPRSPGGPWAGVSDGVRRRAVADAQADAVRHAFGDLSRAVAPLSLGDHRRAADVLDAPEVAAQVRAYLDGQPATNIDFNQDLSVSVTLTVDGSGLADAVGAAMPRPVVPARDWDQVRAAIVRSVSATATGTASAAGPAMAGNLPRMVLPNQPPGWVDGQLEAEGSAVAPAGRRSSVIKVKGLADAAAVAALRQKLLALRVGPTTTLADAAGIDPQLAAGIARVLLDARDYDVAYKADGSVRVRIRLDLRSAWDQLRGSR